MTPTARPTPGSAFVTKSQPSMTHDLQMTEWWRKKAEYTRRVSRIDVKGRKNPPHRDHAPSVHPVPRVLGRVARQVVVHPEVALPLHGLIIAGEGFEDYG